MCDDRRNVSRSLSLLLVVWLALMPQDADAEGRVARHGDWLAGCDNLGRCVALGMSSSSDATGPGIAVRIASDGSAPGSLSMELIPVGVTRNTPTGLGVGPALDAMLSPGGRRILQAAQAARWLDALRQGLPVRFDGPDAEHWSAPSAEGFAEAWREFSGARLTIPSGASARQAPERRRLSPAVEGLAPGRPPVQLLRFACPGGGDAGEPRRFTWSNQATLWSVICTGTTGGRHHWMLEPRPHQPLVPLELPDIGGASIAAGRAGLANSVFDFDFGILRAWDHPPGREDCGIQRAWAFDGHAWYLLERREMPVCGGLDPADWIATYTRR